MADSKITGLTELSVPDRLDVIELVDKSDTTDDAAGSSRRVELQRALAQVGFKPCQGRLTLSSGNPVYSPNSLTPSATDTTGDTVDFAAAHGWTSGTMVTPVTTGGGLTAGTTYYINATDADTVSFHTTLTNALAGTSKVDLTASITSQLTALGVANTTLFFAPYNGNLVALYDGTRWELWPFTERSLALGTLTATLPYDVFLFNNAGTLTPELTAWTSDTARATALALQDGVWCKTGALTRRYLGTIRTVDTTSTEDSRQNRFVWNANQPVLRVLYKADLTSHTYTSSTYRYFNNTATNHADFVIGLAEQMVLLNVLAGGTAASGGLPTQAAALDWTTGSPAQGTRAIIRSGVTASQILGSSSPVVPSVGYHFIAALESEGSNTASSTFSSIEISAGLWG